MTVEAVAASLGAAPGIALIVHAAWRHWMLRRRMATVAARERHAPGGECAPGRRFDLWTRPHCFARPEDSPGVAAAKRELLAYRPRLVRGVLAGGGLALGGGALGLLVARAIA